MALKIFFYSIKLYSYICFKIVDYLTKHKIKIFSLDTNTDTNYNGIKFFNGRVKRFESENYI